MERDWKRGAAHSGLCSRVSSRKDILKVTQAYLSAVTPMVARQRAMLFTIFFVSSRPIFPPLCLPFPLCAMVKPDLPHPPPPPPLSNLPSWPRLMMLVFSPDGPGKGKHSYPSLLALNGLNETPPPNFLSNPPPCNNNN